MVVKTSVTTLEKIRDILKNQNGILLTSDLVKLGIPRTYLSVLLKKGEIQRISRGVYSSANDMVDEMTSLQARYKIAVFSHETALFLLGLTDRTPLYYSVTVQAGYNASSLKAKGAKVYFVNRAEYLIGVITTKSPHGNDIRTFNIERTICDVVRSRNQMDIQFVNEALKKYVIQQDINIDRLYDYARQFRIQKIAREYLEVLL
jgi:predicted transcriptional regulator of viral defense system